MGIPIWMLGLGTRIAKKMVTKKIVEKGLDYLTGEDDFVKKEVYGIKELNVEPPIDSDHMQNVFNRWAGELLHTPVREWDEDDYNAMRSSDGYMEDWDKRKMVLEYMGMPMILFDYEGYAADTNRDMRALFPALEDQ